MLNSIDQLFYNPIKDLDNFRLIKENISFQDFINLYEQLAGDEEKINSLKELKTIFSHNFSQINICSFCYTYSKASLDLLNKNEIDNEENLAINNSNYSFYSNRNNNFIIWLINEYFSENNEQMKELLCDIILLITPIIGLNRYDMSKAYEELTKIYFYSEKNFKIVDFLKNLKLLSRLYGLREDNININEKDNTIKNQIINKPYNYYYFKGKESIQISPVITGIEKSKINDGFSILFCFNCILNRQIKVN